MYRETERGRAEREQIHGRQYIRHLIGIHVYTHAHLYTAPFESDLQEGLRNVGLLVLAWGAGFTELPDCLHLLQRVRTKCGGKDIMSEQTHICKQINRSITININMNVNTYIYISIYKYTCAGL